MTEYQILKEPGGYRIWEHKRIAGDCMGFDAMKPLDAYETMEQSRLARVELYHKLPLSELWLEGFLEAKAIIEEYVKKS